MKRKLLEVLLLLGLLCAVLCGCGDGSPEKTTEDGQTSGSSNSDAAAAADGRENAITVGIAQDLDDSLDPHKVVAAGTKEVMFNVFEGLVKPSPEGDLLPAVASEFSLSEDQTTYTFTLREGVRFHNGEPVTVDDVIWSIQRCAAATEAGVFQEEAFSVIQKLEAPDEKTVVITIQEPNSEFLSHLTVAVLPKDYTGQDAAPVGTGPFRFVSRAAQDHIVLEKFQDYWGEPAYLDKVTFKIIENADSIMMSLQSGAIDLFSHLTSTQVAQLGDEFYIEEGTMNLVQAMYLNNAEKPFDDVRVRQALCYAVDKQGIIDLAFDGYGSPIGSSMYPAFSKYFDESLTNYYTRDIEKAKALLADAGYPDGFSMTITVPSNYQPHIDTAQVIVEQLKEIGVNAEIQLVEWGSWVEDTYNGRKFQATVVGVDASTMTARALLERFVSDYRKNFINYNSPAYDELFQRVLASGSDEEQTALYKEMEAELTKNAANVYIQDLADLVAVRKGLEGVRFYPIYVLDLSTVRYSA
ncbi:MAG: ABC transporter substrate-binding protein [Oscillibacter sp.]|jgi:peptide/nickel transport system substrate-binding protein|nr:ABC transporter substrate-binding protein [Oscillibacter sp.]MCI9001235.1 ABC transporter substrate-binding protein [Oscillibacter sp.]